jgi:hypothetical protein
MKATLGALAAAATIVTAYPSVAQVPAWAVGTWRGSMEGYRNDPGGPDRVMIVEPSGRCRWDYANKAASAAAAKSCTFGADTVDLLTGGSSTVKLKHVDGKLRGSFTPAAGGKPFSVTLSK